MTDMLHLLPALLGGLGLGAFFFGGLWWTVQRALASRRPARWFLGSYLLRTAVALAGLYWLADSRWQPLLAALTGFLAARLIATRLSRPEHAGRPAEETDHAA